jgi:transcription antitermination factor NusG
MRSRPQPSPTHVSTGWPRDERRVGDSVCEWFALQVWTGREQPCAVQLRARGYDVFLPSYWEQRRWSDRIKRIERAMFAGYLFCRLSPDAPAKAITTPGVLRILGDREGPLPVRPDEIEALQRIVAAERLVEPWPYLQAGERVRIETGPLAGAEGTVVRLKAQHRLVVSVSLLQRSVAVEIDHAWVIRSSDRRPGSHAQAS